MAITSGFFNSANGDRLYNAAQIGRYLQYIVSSGVYAYQSDSLQVLANDGMEVQVQAGRAMLDHHFMENDAPITLALTAGGTQDRIDAVVMYVDMTERACGIAVKEGTPAAAPEPPALTRTDVRKEFMLAKIYITKLTSSISQANITDTRADTAVCGWVTGLIKQVDTSTLFAQWQTAYEEAYAELGDYLAAQKAAWDAFFTAVSEDSLVPVPNVDAIGYALKVNETGDGYILAPISSVLYAAIPAASWTEQGGRYVQTVAVEGLPAGVYPDVDIYLDGLTVEQEDAITEAWGGVVKIVPAAGSLTLYFSAQPETDIPIKIKVVK